MLPSDSLFAEEFQMSTLTRFLALMPFFLLSGCLSTPSLHKGLQDNVDSTFGDEYRTLKLPINKPYIGAEWIIKDEMPNRTRETGVTEIIEEQSVNHLNRSQTDKVAAKLALLNNLAPSAAAAAEMSRMLEASNLTIVRPANMRLIIAVDKSNIILASFNFILVF